MLTNRIQPTTEAPELRQELLTVDEVGQIVGFSRSTIWRMVQRGEFPAARVLNGRTKRWIRSDLFAWIHSLKSA